MRQVYATLAGGMAALLLGIGLLLVYDRTGYDLALPGAAEIQNDGPPSARQRQVSFRLPPNGSLSDVYKHLTSKGWSRDLLAEQRWRRDQLDDNYSLGMFTRQRLFGLLFEIALVKGSPADPRRVEIQIVRCFRLFSPDRCY
jgi:hypothetical protein